MSRRAVVTGCASGIGEQLVHVLARDGVEVVGLDRRETTAPVSDFVAVDLNDSTSIARAADAIADPVDALFNVAGVSGAIPPDVVVGINFVGTRELTERLVPRLAPGAAIVNTASVAASHYVERRALAEALLATPDRDAALAWCHANAEAIGTGYAISKDAIAWYTLHRALELAGVGVRMNAVAPGITQTPIVEDSRRARGDGFLDAIPMPAGRMAQPREQAEALAFLGSPQASYVSGQILWVDGGYMAGVATGALANVTGSVGAAPSTNLYCARGRD